MSATGIRKAALLLMDLQPATAAELLKSVQPNTMTRIVAELAYLQKTGVKSDSDSAREFCTLVSKKKSRQDSCNLADQILENALGADKAREMMTQVREVLRDRDPFASLRSASVAALAKALEGEAPQIVTMLLCELTAAKSAQLLAMLAEDVRIRAVQCMAGGLLAPPEVKIKVAAIIGSRLKKKEDAAQPGEVEAEDGDDQRQRQLRKVAVLLRSLEKSLRDTLLRAIVSQNAQTAGEVNKLMVIWDDIPLVADRTLQETLRTVDTRKLALSLVKAAPAVAGKFRSNMSERAAAMVDEETSLLSSPKPADVQQAREAVLDALRTLNDKGELTFQEVAE